MTWQMTWQWQWQKPVWWPTCWPSSCSDKVRGQRHQEARHRWWWTPRGAWPSGWHDGLTIGLIWLDEHEIKTWQNFPFIGQNLLTFLLFPVRGCESHWWWLRNMVSSVPWDSLWTQALGVNSPREVSKFWKLVLPYVWGKCNTLLKLEQIWPTGLSFSEKMAMFQPKNQSVESNLVKFKKESFYPKYGAKQF